MAEVTGSLDTFSLAEAAPQLPSKASFPYLQNLVERAHNEGVIQSLPWSREEVVSSSELQGRIRTIQTRLYLLGFSSWIPVVEPDEGEEFVIDERIRDGIGRFQEQAVLTVDRWVGEQTWTALEELVAFEKPTHIGRWLIPSRRDVLMRAVRLRLFALGFLPIDEWAEEQPEKERPPRPQMVKEAKVQLGLASFAQVARDLMNLDFQVTKIFDPDDTPPVAPDMHKLLSLLFNPDEILTQLASGSDALYQEYFERGKGSLQRSFMINVAKIELWLLGYSTPPDGQDEYETPNILNWNPKLFRAVENYWFAMEDMPPGRARGKAEKIDKALFQSLNRFSSIQQGDAQALKQFYDQIKNRRESTLTKIWERIKGIGSRLWDGIKRAWGWLSSVLLNDMSNSAKGFETWLGNAARFLYNTAARIFDPLLRAATGLRSAVKFISSRMGKQTVSANESSIAFKTDFDTILFSSGVYESFSLRRQVTYMARHAVWFRVGLKMLGTVGRILTTIPQIFLGFGWFSLIVTLFRSYFDLRRLARELPARFVPEPLPGHGT